MPDVYGFNELGDKVRCIDCAEGGPIWEWPEKERRRHARSHGRDRRQQAVQSREVLEAIKNAVDLQQQLDA